MNTPRVFLSIAAALALSACAANAPNVADMYHLNSVSRLRLAQAAEKSGDFNLAEAMYKAASKAAPRDAKVQLSYAALLLRLGKVHQAREELERHLQTVYEPELLQGGLGAIYVLEGNPAQAIREFDAVLKKKPDETRWMVDKAVALDLLKRHTEAQHLYRRALAANPDDAATINDLGLSLALSGRQQEAAQTVAPLSERTDLSSRARTNYKILRAADNEPVDGESPQVLRIARAIGEIRPNN